MKRVVLLLPIVVLALVLAGCSHSNNTQDTATPVPAQNQAADKTVTGNAVMIRNFTFSPATLTVKKGAVVTWTNNDSAPHQLKSVTFNSDKLSTGQSFSFTFNETGMFDYSCTIHPSMQGKIIVE